MQHNDLHTMHRVIMSPIVTEALSRLVSVMADPVSPSSSADDTETTHGEDLESAPLA